MQRASQQVVLTALAAILAASVAGLDGATAQSPARTRDQISPAWPETPVARVDTIQCLPRQHGMATEVAILDFKSGIGGTLNPDAVYELLNRVTGDPRIGAIALRIDSSGGDSYVAKKLYDILREARTACPLPMESFIGKVGTSGGFWLALPADAIHADAVSTVGAIGIVAIYKNEKEKHDKEGIRYTVVRTGERKWPLIPFLPVEEADVRKVERSLQIVLDEFVRAVEISRKGKLKLTRDQLTTGEAWMGAEAQGLGLVDAPESIDRASQRMLGAPPTAYRLFDLAKAAGSIPAPPVPAPVAPPLPPAIARN